MTTHVRVEPSGIELEVHAGETIMAAATRLGYRWPTVCGGQAECGVCALEVVTANAAEPALAPPGDVERERLLTLAEARRFPERRYRLACQLEPAAGVDVLVVRKRGLVAVR